jgi:hypothetical protein
MARRVIAVVVLLCAGVLASGASAGACQRPSLKLTGDFSNYCCTHQVSRTYVIRNTGGSRSGVLTASLSFNPIAPGQAFAITSDRCTGKSLRPKTQCAVELTWLAGADTLVTLTVASSRTSVSSPELVGYAVP